MKTVTSETQDPTTLLDPDDETSYQTPLNEIRHFIKTLNVTEKSCTIGGETRLIPALR